MKFLSKAADGGPASGVTGYFLVEIKWLFSVVLLHFAEGSREAFHEHAFNAYTIWLAGEVREEHRDGRKCFFSAGMRKRTPRYVFHKIIALKSSWALSFRGPWVDHWREDRSGSLVTLTHGRRVVAPGDVPKTGHDPVAGWV